MAENNLKAKCGKNFWKYLLLILTICLSLYSIICPLERIRHGHYMDFIHFYDAARAIMLGTPLYESGYGGYIYPPFFAFLLLPLAHLSYEFASVVWLGVNLSLIIIIVLSGLRVLAKSFQLTLNRWQMMNASLFAILLTYDQVRGVLVQGQSDALVLAGFALALLWIDRKPLLSGALLGIVALIKYQSFLFLPFMLCRLRLKVIAAFIFGAAFAALLPSLVIGWNRNLDYLAIAYHGLTNMGSIPSSVNHAANIPTATWIYNISITSGLMRIFQDYSLPESAALILIIFIAVLIFCCIWWMFRRYQIPFLWRSPNALKNRRKEFAVLNLEYYALLMVILIFSPQCVKRHTLLLLNANLLAVALLMFPRPGVKRWPVIAGIVISQLGYDFGLLFPQKPGWNYIGGPCWTLLPFLLLLIYGALNYIHDLYNPSNPAVRSEKI